jgi:hypothetical protein
MISPMKRICITLPAAKKLEIRNTKFETNTNVQNTTNDQNELRMYRVLKFEFWICLGFRYSNLDSYILKSENLSRTLMSPLIPPSPLREERKGEGEISNIFG